jgi:3-hydroxyisobutyrate dehydrogenase
MEQIGFVGIGRMGFPMARHIVERGRFPVTVFDIRPEPAEGFCAGRAARRAARLADLGTAGIVLLMLPTSREVEEILLGGPQGPGLIDHLSSGALVIDCSTSDPVATQRLGARLAERGIAMVDAPVMGGVVFAEDGSLDIFVGGTDPDIARAEPVLRCFGKEIFRCGALGFAHAMKAINNFVNAQALVTYAEAMTVGAKFGIDRDVLTASLISATTGRNHPFEKKMVKHVLSGTFATGMALRLIAKDVSLALSVAQKTGAWSPIIAQTAELWAQAAQEIGGELDQTVVAKLWEEKTGVTISGG